MSVHSVVDEEVKNRPCHVMDAAQVSETQCSHLRERYGATCLKKECQFFPKKKQATSIAAAGDLWSELLAKAKKAFASKKLVEVPWNKCSPDISATRPRKYHDSDAQTSLTESIRSVGQTIPGFCRKTGDELRILEGNRRWKAVRSINHPDLLYQTFVIECDDDVVPFVMACITSGNREDLSPLDKSAAILYLYNEVGLPMEVIAKEIFGISKATAENLESLQFLDQANRALLARGVLKLSHAYEVVRRNRFDTKAQIADAKDYVRTPARTPSARPQRVRAQRKVVALSEDQGETPLTALLEAEEHIDRCATLLNKAVGNRRKMLRDQMQNTLTRISGKLARMRA